MKTVMRCIREDKEEVKGKGEGEMVEVWLSRKEKKEEGAIINIFKGEMSHPHCCPMELNVLVAILHLHELLLHT